MKTLKCDDCNFWYENFMHIREFQMRIWFWDFTTCTLRDRNKCLTTQTVTAAVAAAIDQKFIFASVLCRHYKFACLWFDCNDFFEWRWWWWCDFPFIWKLRVNLSLFMQHPKTIFVIFVLDFLFVSSWFFFSLSLRFNAILNHFYFHFILWFTSLWVSVSCFYFS